MNQDTKQLIASGAAEYARSKGLANSEVARQTKVNAAYISQIFRGIFHNVVEGKEVPIGDTHFARLAEWAQIPLTKQYWKLLPTVQFMEMITLLEAAKTKPQALMIINDTGMGKTHAVDLFCNKHPQHTFRLTVGDSYTLRDIINELMDLLGVDASYMNVHTTASLRSRLNKINARLEDIRNSGGNPIIIFDEAENLRAPTLKTIKEIYDATIQYCSIVLIGTVQILQTMDGTRNWKQRGLPQIKRRFKAGIRHITPLHKPRDFTPFFDQHQVAPGLRQLISSLADNYGELHDYLEPALREADQRGEPLTEELFRIMYNLPSPRPASPQGGGATNRKSIAA